MSESFDRARWAELSVRFPTLHPLLRMEVPPVQPLPASCGVLTGSAAVIRCCAADMGPKQLFFRAADAEEADLRAVHGRCLYLLERWEDLPRLDALAGPLLADGRLEEVAIRLSPVGEGPFTEETLPALARQLRRTDTLVVRSAFLTLSGAEDLSSQARAAFSLIKRLRADLPCLLHAFCLEGVLEPLLAGDEPLTHTLEMLAALNDTSLYARFYIA